MHAIFRCIMQHINALAQPCCGMHWAAKLLYSPTRRGLRFPKRDGCAAAMSSAQGGPHASGPHDVYIHRKAESLLCGGGGGGVVVQQVAQGLGLVWVRAKANALERSVSHF